MCTFENLSPIKKKFLASIGIYSYNDMPSSFHEKILHLNSAISEAERFCIEDYHLCYQSQDTVNLKDIIGTDHDRYAGKTWFEAFSDLDRGDENIELYFNNPGYYSELLQKGQTDLGLAEKGGKYYILGKSGGGNNRLIIMKLKYLATINNSSSNQHAIDNEFSIFANIRHVPTKNTADNIFYLIFPNGGFQPSGYYALNKSNDPNEELYDIVIDYPQDTKIIASNVRGEDIGVIENQDLPKMTK